MSLTQDTGTVVPLKKKTGTPVFFEIRCGISPVFRYNPVSVEWQQQACRQLGLKFVCEHNCVPGGPDIQLTYPSHVEKMRGDGSRLFRAMCYVITGSQRQHYRLRCIIVEYMRSLIGTRFERNLLGTVMDGNSIEEYLSRTRMSQQNVWGTQTEMTVLAHMLDINVLSFSVEARQYSRYTAPLITSGSYDDDIDTLHSIYIYSADNHFDVIQSVE